MPILSFLAVAISILGICYFLLACAAVVFLIWGLRWLAGIAGIAIPQFVWALLGFVLVILLIIMFVSGSGISVH
jgi:hypothetical protein